MKGKEAARAATRRAAEASAQVEELRQELADCRGAAQQQIHALEEQVRHERANHLREASRLAATEVAQRMAEAEKERHSRGLSDDIVKHMLYRNDRLILNACRYVSMTTGAGPDTAIAMVLTWRTDKDVSTLPRVEQLIELGIPMDGWVARQIKKVGHWRKTKMYQNMAISLDKAEELGLDRIHPRYRPSWYPKVEYGGIEFIENISETLVSAREQYRAEAMS